MFDKITIDGVEYKISDLDKSVMEQIHILHMVDKELESLRFQFSTAQKARSAYAAALSAALPKTHQ